MRANLLAARGILRERALGNASKIYVLEDEPIFMSVNFCLKLKNQNCTLLNSKCFRLRQQSECDFKDHHNLIFNYQHNPPISQKVKKELRNPFIQKWQSYAASPSPGKKNMTGLPLEHSLRKITREELDVLGVKVHEKTRRFNIGEGVYILADVLIEKEKYPTTVISVKSWIGTTQIRETFAYAYLSKLWNGQKNVRVYMTSLMPIPDRIKRVEKICKPYLDRIFSISGEPYFDELISELKILYF